MFLNYLKTLLRFTRKSKLYSFINIAGLAIGIACCILIFLYVQYELSYDTYHKNYDRIYRLTEILHTPKEDNARAVTAPPMANAIRESIPEVQYAVRINYSQRQLSYREQQIADTRIMYADSSLFDIFTYPMLEGSPRHALVNPYCIVLTESTARKYFGNESPMGKFMQLSDTINLMVTGIVKDVPENSHFSFDCVISRTTINKMRNDEPEDNWYQNGYHTYLLLNKNVDHHAVESKIDSTILQRMQDARKETGLWYSLKLQPLGDIHLKSHLNSEIGTNGDITYVYIFSAVALLLLLIACSNFINLTTAKSVERAKEIGLRKVIGGNRKQLIAQFLFESFTYAILGAILAFAIASISLPAFSAFSGRNLSMDMFYSSAAGIVFVAVILGVGFLSGIYPALLMSSFSFSNSLKGIVKHDLKDILFRKGLVVLQFTIAIFLVAGSGLVFEQLKFLQNKNLGLNKDHLMEIPVLRADLGKAQTLLAELRTHPKIVNAGLTDFSFRYGTSSIATLPEGAASNEVSTQRTIAIDENFLPTFQVPLVAGRNFSPSFATDLAEGFIVNETAVQRFGWETPQQALGKGIDWGLGKQGKVIGVVKDFNFASLHDEIKPLILHMMPEDYSFVSLRFKPDNLPATLNELKDMWGKIAVNSPFDYTFLDEDFANLYKAEMQMQSVLQLFTIISIVVACLGLLGLATFTVRQRYKEIGVRKVLGASVLSITHLLSKDFLKLVAIAVFIAVPIAWIAVDKWLENFAYKTTISWWVLGLAAASTLLVALLTVGFQTLKAAHSNPVDNLRTE